MKMEMTFYQSCTYRVGISGQPGVAHEGSLSGRRHE